MQAAAQRLVGQTLDSHTADAIGVALHAESVLRLNALTNTHDNEIIFPVIND